MAGKSECSVIKKIIGFARTLNKSKNYWFRTKSDHFQMEGRERNAEIGKIRFQQKFFIRK